MAASILPLSLPALETGPSRKSRYLPGPRRLYVLEDSQKKFKLYWFFKAKFQYFKNFMEQIGHVYT